MILRVALQHFKEKKDMIEVIKKRGEGKTWDIIQLSSELQVPIIKPSLGSKRYTTDLAHRMGRSIPDPIVFERDKIRGFKGKYLIDDIECCRGLTSSLDINNMVGYSFSIENILPILAKLDKQDERIKQLEEENRVLKFELSNLTPQF